MAFSEALAARIRGELEGVAGSIEKKMFGGVAFMLLGNMAVGVIGEDMMVRVGPERHTDALSMEYARPFDMTGRPMAGWVVVASPGLENEASFQEWVRWGVNYALSLPPK
jgi:hypothetical protein